VNTEPSDPTRPNRAPELPSLDRGQLDALFASIAAETVDARSGPLETLRELPTARRVGLTIAFQVVVAAVGIGVHMPRGDWGLVLVPLLVIGVLGGMGSAVSLKSSGTSSTPLGRLSPWLLIVPAVVALPNLWPGRTGLGFWEAMPIHIGCLLGSAMIALLATLPFIVMERHGLLRRWSLLAAAGSAGSIAFVVQVATCPLTTFEHRFFAHGFAGVGVAAVLVTFVWIRSRIRG
jgi:hypothetical protein